MPRPQSWIDQWGQALVHGLIGGVLGGLVGLAIGAGVMPESWLWIAGGMAALCAVLAATFGDRFWHSFREGSLLNPLNWW